jgi:hypothetical protein
VRPNTQRAKTGNVSFGLTISSDNKFSRSTSKAEMASFISRLPHIIPNGENGFALDERDKRWMEIDLEVVSREGDYLEEVAKSSDVINCVRLRIPSGFLTDSVERDYLPTAFAIARKARWVVFDDQTGEVVRRSWWKFW